MFSWSAHQLFRLVFLATRPAQETYRAFSGFLGLCKASEVNKKVFKGRPTKLFRRIGALDRLRRSSAPPFSRALSERLAPGCLAKTASGMISWTFKKKTGVQALNKQLNSTMKPVILLCSKKTGKTLNGLQGLSNTSSASDTPRNKPLP